MMKKNSSYAWEELHSDLLLEIVKHLHSAEDYVRCRAVCKSWNLKLPKTPNHIRGPWLVLPLNHDTIKDDKDFYLRLPELRNTMVCGSSFGWLTSVGTDGVIQMLNPFTDVQFDLPPMSTIPDIISQNGDEYTIKHVRFMDGVNISYISDKHEVKKKHIQKVILSCPPDDNNAIEDFMAITIYGKLHRLAFCKFADKTWTDFSVPEPELYHDCGLDDAIFHKGYIYAIDFLARLFVFDKKTSMGIIIRDVPSPQCINITSAPLNTNYLFHDADGDLLMAIRHSNTDEIGVLKTSAFHLYKLDESVKQWIRIFSLGNYVLVVGFNSSACMLPFPSAKGNWARNCIYYSDHIADCHRPNLGGRDVGVFNLEDGSIEELFPNSTCLYPPPLWLFSQNFIS
ncbi:hypothetical protein RIF29_14114 [Crotalaria pallida]|uniref:F-box domain-containing protein n=1 Tax=Crotalaria pallida TaxID=3830 RepID=A0AAN9IA05_CROPI